MTYISARKGAAANDFLIDRETATLLESIPDDYHGPLAEEILAFKSDYFSGKLREVYVEERDRLLGQASEKANSVNGGDISGSQEEKNASEVKNASVEKDNTDPDNHKSSTSGGSSYYNHTYDPDDYDSPEDFADDAWGDEFDDWDDAYDYWEDW